MLNKVIFENQITLYWEKDWENENVQYRIYCNTNIIDETKKTHYTLKNLIAETEYEIKVEKICGTSTEILFLEKISTKKAKKRLDVSQAPYNAVGDGQTLNTLALQRAIDDCKDDECVYFPSGIYLSGALKLHSNMEVYLENGAVLQGSSRAEDYLPKIKSRFEGITMECYSGLLNIGDLDENNYGCVCENIILRGEGTIYGGGKTLMDNVIAVEKERLKEYLETHEAEVKACDNPDVIPARARGRLINISNCRNVIICNIKLGFGAGWNVHMVYSKDILTFGCTISSKGIWNGDGWNPDSSENCVIFDTAFDTHDDAIAIKSGKNPEGNIINRPTKKIRVFDCYGTRGLAIGSELSGGIEDVAVWDCSFITGSGFRLKTTQERGGYVRNVKVKDCAFGLVEISGRYSCNGDGESSGMLTEIDNISFKNVESFGRSTAYFTFAPLDVPCLCVHGFEDKQYYFNNLSFKNMLFHTQGKEENDKIKVANVNNLIMENISVEY